MVCTYALGQDQPEPVHVSGQFFWFLQSVTAKRNTQHRTGSRNGRHGSGLDSPVGGQPVSLKTMLHGKGCWTVAKLHVPSELRWTEQARRTVKALQVRSARRPKTCTDVPSKIKRIRSTILAYCLTNFGN
ncbi:hypothetical protein pipiens_012880 [Culex pipiens pipiens]|uniref:Uncharacterized protein n=1 Tax=Culex pipiens pipiens TaxID=38569 RepID=A0ABD1D1S4_CULPP